MKEIKKVDYNEMECLAEDEAVCPYCGYENCIEPDDYKGQDEEEFEVCGECERTFVHEINYRITFTSEPLENYYLRRKEYFLERIKNLEEKIKEDGKFKEMHTSHLFFLKQDLEDFESEMVEMLEVGNGKT